VVADGDGVLADRLEVDGHGLTAHVNDPNNAYSWRCWASWDHTT
jgi:hypothetical protein